MLHLNRQERWVVVFLAAVLLTGSVLQMLVKRNTLVRRWLGFLQSRRVEAPVDLNRASAQDLEQIPQVGRSTARAIIRYRQSHGGFRNAEELRRVPGIGPGRFRWIRPYVRAGNPEAGR